MLQRVGPWLPDGQEVLRGAPWAALPGLLVLFFGGFDDLLRSLMVAVLLDVVTGVACAYISRRLASYQLVRGVVRKLLYFAAVALAVLADGLLPGVIIAGVEVSVRVALIWALLGAEMLSITENLALAGVPLPPWLVERLQAWQDEQATETRKSGRR
jgi:toxin secretion/phage lysis holin